MVSTSLLTFCVAMTCSILESEIEYKIIAASNSVHVLKHKLRASRVKLRGFSEWLPSKTDSDAWDMLGALDNTVNPALQEIRKTVNIGITQGKDAEHCYTKAHARTKEEAEKHLALVMPCIETFMKTTEASLVDIPDRLHEISNLEDDMVTILPDCQSWTDKGICIHKRLKKVTTPVLNIANFARNIVERGNNNYRAQHSIAIKCLTQHFQDLDKQMSTIKSEANDCVRQS